MSEGAEIRQQFLIGRRWMALELPRNRYQVAGVFQPQCDTLLTIGLLRNDRCPKFGIWIAIPRGLLLMDGPRKALGG
jgi:hypothetical protein